MPNRRTPEQNHAEEAAGRQLQRWLLTEERYYEFWVPAGEPTPPSRVDQEAVARVLGKQFCKERHWTYVPDDRRHKDRVRRAFTGEAFTKATLNLFVRAFAMTEQHATQLHELRSGRRRPEVIRGHLKPTETSAFRDEHQTDQLHETHYIGQNRQPVKHRTLQYITSLVDNLRSYQFRFVSDDDFDLIVERGGTAGLPYDLNERVRAIDIELDQPLAYSEGASLEYWMIFKTPVDSPPYFNRAVRHAVASLEICVVFLDVRPRQVWWAEWDDYGKDANIVHEVPWSLKVNSVDRRLARVEHAVFGFHWLW